MICDRCGKPIAGTPDDPICWTSLGRHHQACMRAASADVQTAKEDRRQRANERRSATQKARWATRKES